MSKSFTGDLRGVSISQFAKITVPERKVKPDDWALGTIVGDYSPASCFSESLFPAVATCMLLHENYMCAACDCESDYARVMPAMSYLVSFLTFTTAGGSFGDAKYTLPLIVAPDTIVRYNNKQGERVSKKAGTRGLYCRAGMVVKASADLQDDMAGTMAHEMGHALLSMVPQIKDMMYGHDRDAMIEECCMHMLSDHRSILRNFENISFDPVTTYGEGIEDGDEVSIVSPSTATLYGKSLIGSEYTLSGQDKQPLRLSTPDGNGVINSYYSKIRDQAKNYVKSMRADPVHLTKCIEADKFRKGK